MRVSEYNAYLFAIAQRTQATSPKASTRRRKELEIQRLCWAGEHTGSPLRVRGYRAGSARQQVESVCCCRGRPACLPKISDRTTLSLFAKRDERSGGSSIIPCNIASPRPYGHENSSVFNPSGLRPPPLKQGRSMLRMMYVRLSICPF